VAAPAAARRPLAPDEGADKEKTPIWLVIANHG
jgi:hypothetical protein